MNNLFKSAIPFAVLALLSFGSSAYAADEDEDADSVEEVVVTGSRISRTSNYDTTGPVDVFSAQDVIDSGKTNIGDFLIELPAANLSANATNQRSVNNGNTGTTEFSLRGAGSERLLTLINGRRVAPAGTGTGSAVDLQIFPLSLIDSVEVLKDGASAVYGSDAVSGVLNVKLRDFEGFEAYITEGSSNKGDAKQDMISLAFGTTGERSSMVATIAQSKQDSLDMWDRDFAFCPRLEPDYMHYFQYFGIAGHGAPGEKVSNEASCGASTFIPTGRFYTSEGSKTLYGDVGPNGPTSSFSFATYSGNRAGDPENNMGMYNYNQWMQLLGGRENRQAWTAGNYELDSGVVLDFQIGVSKRDSDLMMAPVPMGSGANFTYGLTIPADNPFNPFGEDLAYRKRMLDVGPRMFSQKSSNYRVEFGASGVFERINADWEAYATYQDFSQSAQTRNYINMLAVANSFDLEVGGPNDLQINGVGYRCADPIARQLGCVPLNMFGGNSITQEAADYIRQNEKRTYGTTYQGYAFNVSNIALAELPAGEILAAFGAEMVDLSGFENVDGLTEAGGSSGNPRLSTAGSYDSRDIYGEVSIPLVADIPGFQELNIDYAYRATQYSQFDSESVERTAIKWKPISDVTVRFTDSTSYKAPTISDLYFGGGGGFPTYVDPCEASQYNNSDAATQANLVISCGAAGLDPTTWATSNNQILVVNEGNPNLIPESGSNQTIGIVWQPTTIEFLANIDFKIAVDQFEMEIANAVVSTGSQNSLNQCYFNNRPEFCDLLTRTYGGDVASVNTNNINSSSMDLYEGTDYSMNMNFDDVPLIGGSLEVDVIGTHFDQYVAVDETGISDDRVGKCYNFGDNCFNRDRTNLTFRWYKDDWTVSMTTRFLSEIPLDEDVVSYYESDPYGFTASGELTASELQDVYDVHSIDDYSISYLNIRYQATDAIDISLAISNLFDKEPPYYKDLFGFVDPQINTPQNTYDIIGRYYTVGFKLTL